MSLRSFYETILVRVGARIAETSYRVDHRRLRRELDDVTGERNELLQQLLQQQETMVAMRNEIDRLRREECLLADVRSVLRKAGIRADTEAEGVTALALEKAKGDGARTGLRNVRQQLVDAGITVGALEEEGVITLRKERDAWKQNVHTMAAEHQKTIDAIRGTL